MWQGRQHSIHWRQDKQLAREGREGGSGGGWRQGQGMRREQGEQGVRQGRWKRSYAARRVPRWDGSTAGECAGGSRGAGRGPKGNGAQYIGGGAGTHRPAAWGGGSGMRGGRVGGRGGGGRRRGCSGGGGDGSAAQMGNVVGYGCCGCGRGCGGVWRLVALTAPVARPSAALPGVTTSWLQGPADEAECRPDEPGAWQELPLRPVAAHTVGCQQQRTTEGLHPWTQRGQWPGPSCWRRPGSRWQRGIGQSHAADGAQRWRWSPRALYGSGCAGCCCRQAAGVP